MKTATAPLTQDILEAWDLFSQASYEDLLALKSSSQAAEIADLQAVAALLRDEKPAAPGEPDSLFAPLRAAFAARQAGWNDQAAKLLAGWLLSRDYYCESIIQTFVDAARESEHFELVEKVAARLLPRRAGVALLSEALFVSLYQADRHKEAVMVFEKFREHFNDSATLQKVAISFMRLNRFQQAEELLIPLYVRITGAEYQMRYEEVRQQYAGSIQKIPALEAKAGNRSMDDNMELGMAYLFEGRYAQALGIFQSLMARAA